MTKPKTVPMPDTTSATAPDAATILQDTRAWLEKAVIGLNLCPFAKAVARRGQIRYIVSGAQFRDTLALELATELSLLAATDPENTDTTLLIHPLVLTDFFDYNAFLAQADRIVGQLGLEGVLQVASFHPDYEFADCAADAMENCTNRSPYPMLHLLREASITRAIEAFPDAEAIYEKNIATLQALGTDGWQALGVGASRGKA